ncbi:MAG TPA: LysR substrate-binding domain-containing protein [Actinomycetota bacterium]|jgi:DNA-binding transcriptional LysR family regulator
MAEAEQSSGVDEPDVREIVRLADPLGEGVRERAGQEGRLTIASVSVAAEFVMPPLLALFRSRHAEVGLVMLVGNRASTLQRILYGEADLAVGGRPPASVGIRGEPFLGNRFVVAAMPGHPLVSADPVDAKVLSDQTWLLREPGSGSRRAAEVFWGRKGIEPRSVVTLGSVGAVRQAAALGMGITLVSAYAVAADFEEGKLAQLAVPATPEGSWYALFLGRGRPVTAAVQFLDLLHSVDAASAVEGWFGKASRFLSARHPLREAPA